MKHSDIPMKDEFEKDNTFWLRIVIYISCIIGIIILLIGCDQPGWAQEIPYSDTQIVNAIFMAEGGYHATYPFGIRSVICQGYTACRKVCLTTVKHNRRRFIKYGFKTSPSFVSFLRDRYCPIRETLSITERKLNKNWIKNVNYFLRKQNAKTI